MHKHSSLLNMLIVSSCKGCNEKPHNQAKYKIPPQNKNMHRNTSTFDISKSLYIHRYSSYFQIAQNSITDDDPSIG